MRFLSATLAWGAIALCASAFLAPSPAHADSTPMDLFTLSYGNQTLTYELPTQPSPAAYGELYNFVLDVTATYNGGGTCSDSLEFYTASPGGGGFQDSCMGLAPNTDPGVQLFSGDVSSPTFIPATYDFTEDSTAGSLTISQVGAAPEPSSLLLLATGIMGVAGAVRRRFLAQH